MSFLDGLTPEHIAPTDDLALAAQRFKNSVNMVEIEIFSYCNRRCWFCPNAHIDRITHNIRMKPEVYTSILNQLASIDYTGTITYSRYNEPLADRIILDRLREAKERLPYVYLHTNTNGDYLDVDYLDELYAAGLRSLNVQIYLKNHEQYDHGKIIKRGNQTLRRLSGISYRVTRDEPGLWYEVQFEYKDMSLRMYGRNFAINGTSRGGQVDINRDYVRTSPCAMPFTTVYIDYNGKMVPCCNFRSDIPEHADYILSDAEVPDLFATYSSEKATRFRRSLVSEKPKEGPCSNCFFALETVTPQMGERLARVAIS